jgi:hypothetical protein
VCVCVCVCVCVYWKDLGSGLCGDLHLFKVSDEV